MKKFIKVIGLCVGLFVGSAVVCGIYEGITTDNIEHKEPQQVEEQQIQEEQKVESDFDKYNILTFNAIEIDSEPDYEGDEYVDFKCKVTNNSDEMISTITVNYALYDDEGTLLSETYPQIPESIPGGNSFYSDGLYNANEYDVAGIKITGYSYYIGDNYYSIDLVNQTAEVYEVLN